MCVRETRLPTAVLLYIGAVLASNLLNKYLFFSFLRTALIASTFRGVCDEKMCKNGAWSLFLLSLKKTRASRTRIIRRVGFPGSSRISCPEIQKKYFCYIGKR